MPRFRFLALGLVLAACSKPESASQDVASQAVANPALTLQERRLLTAATIALPPEGLVAESLPQPASRGAQLLVAYCTQCHALPSPATHAPQDWPSVARRMWVRIDMMHGELGVATPTSADRMQLLNYLLANALKVAQNLPPGAGREVFEERCSRCHTLPDPRSHSSADWPAVVTRMERNMERMKVSGVTPDQAQHIVLYLEGASRR
ncbi:MAG: hypothetical protein Q7J79_04150 [Gemmatimonadales bacterium]|nr:hypothetical protein [Gemmatimonadales bacterium]